MPTIIVAKKECPLSPLTLADMERVEQQAESDCMAKAESQIERLLRLRIGTDESMRAIFAAAVDEVRSGEAEQAFLRSFSGGAFVLWLSASRMLAISFDDFKRDCQFQEYGKLKSLLDGLLGPVGKQQQQPWEAVKSQEERRIRIFNAICEGQKITPAELAGLTAERAMELYCQYTELPACNPDILKVRIAEYVAVKAAEGKAAEGSKA